MHALGRRELVHGRKVFGEERADLGAGKVVASNIQVNGLDERAACRR